jgi:CPA1 family monovalent cation:H+ antiporter
MSFNAVVVWWHNRYGFHPPRPLMRPTTKTGLLISWAGMRGIVSLAAAMALPASFPYRDLILLTVFAVVVGTLVIQGLTLKPLLHVLRLPDDDPVGREVHAARERAREAALASIEGDKTPAADAVRKEFSAHLRDEHSATTPGIGSHAKHRDIHRDALQSARQAVIDMRTRDEIGDDAFRQVEEELDWIEMAGGKEER